MADITRKKPSDDNEISINELREKYEEVKGEIRKIIKENPDRNSLEEEQKRTLRVKYAAAAGYAKKLSERVTNPEESAQKLNEYKVLADRAQSYGSLAKRDFTKNTSFDDIKGLDEVKKMVKSFVYMSEHADLMKYYKLDGGLGMMMYGAPGTGKTMFAEAIANEMKLPLFVITPADIFKSYVGASEAAVKDLFLEIEACPDGAVLFIDECESIFSKRTSDTKDYKSAVTTELLQRMNGMGVDGAKRIMIAATNRPDKIDPAYLRYKRFSYQVHITPPDDIALRAIIDAKLTHKDGTRIELEAGLTVDDIMNMAESYTYSFDEGDLGRVRKRKAYYSAADISGIIEESCRLALEKLQLSNSSTPIPIAREMLEKSFDKIRPSISMDLLDKFERFKEDKEMDWGD